MCARPLKEGLNPTAIARIGAAFAAADPQFDETRFVRACCRGLDRLDLKARVLRIAEVLCTRLPPDYPAALGCILRAAEAWPARDPADPTSGFAAWPMTDFVGLYGLDHPEESLDALRRLTPLFTAEFAIRPFLIAHTEITLMRLEDWTGDPDERVRRLVSEGTRPRLPWGVRLKRFQEDPAPTLALLEKLKDDPAAYVRRSVANHLNDVSKDHPDLALRVCARWRRGGGEGRDWIVRHAIRGLVKQGHPGALNLLGVSDRPEVEVTAFRIAPKSLKVGDSLAFGFDLASTSKRPQKLVVDYAVHHRKADGKTRPKVFKLKTLELGPRASLRLEKRHSFRPVTTRRYHAGEHVLELLINGRGVARKRFRLEL